MDIKVTYDRTADAVYIYLMEPFHGAAVRQIEAVEQQIILDFDCENRLIGIEVLGARQNLPRSLVARAEPLGSGG